MKVTFLKSDAMAERFPDEPYELVIEFPHNVQFTYGDMRTTRNWPEMGYREGDTVAYIIDGDWVITTSPLGPSNLDATSWSDIIIGNIE
jgi:hypothetical protein